MKAETSNDAVDPLLVFELPYQTQLRNICDAIGYGRTIQIVEQWWENMHPGWLAARDAANARRHKNGKKGARHGRRSRNDPR